MGHMGEVGHRIVGELRIRHEDRRLVEAADASRAKADELHRALDHAVDMNPVADVKPPLADHEQPGDQILEQVLRAERHRDAEQAEAGDQRADLNAPDLQNDRATNQQKTNPDGFDEPLDHARRQQLLELAHDPR